MQVHLYCAIFNIIYIDKKINYFAYEAVNFVF